MLDIVLQAIVEPRRREILMLIRADELAAGEIAAHFDVTRPAISQHLQVLTAAGLVSVRKAGTRRLYQARQPRPGVGSVSAWIDGCCQQLTLVL